jgi:hypothetical protein
LNSPDRMAASSECKRASERPLSAGEGAGQPAVVGRDVDWEFAASDKNKSAAIDGAQRATVIG